MMAMDLFQVTETLCLPARRAMAGRLHGADLVHFASVQETAPHTLSPFSTKRLSGQVAEHDGARLLIVPRSTTTDLGGDPILVVPDVMAPHDIAAALAKGTGRWIRPAITDPRAESLALAEKRCDLIVASWAEAFSFRTEICSGHHVVQKGLRAPQIGALHALLAHWSVTDSPATVVMPTGTGKTETMLATLVCAQVRRVLVVVPGAELRDQIAAKFQTLGVLKACNCMGASGLFPVVATLKHRLTSPADVADLFRRSNVIVTTMGVAGQCAPDIQAEMARLCTHLFIDEAHHVAAPTWNRLKQAFGQQRVVQFTATPFRTDGKKVDGRFVYVYPLAKAQAEEYFKPIRFRAVQGLDQDEIDDEVIALAGRQLDEDLAGGRDHLVMARTDYVERAITLHQKYILKLGRHSPVLIHSRMGAPERQAALAKLHRRESRIIVCVNMLGEGFDAGCCISTAPRAANCMNPWPRPSAARRPSASMESQYSACSPASLA
jgi:hypothetical protein